MKIHEYQAKEVLRKFGVAVPEGKVISDAAEAETVARELGTPVVVVKAQIHAGGRGKVMTLTPSSLRSNFMRPPVHI